MTPAQRQVSFDRLYADFVRMAMAPGACVTEPLKQTRTVCFCAVDPPNTTAEMYADVVWGWVLLASWREDMMKGLIL